MAFLMFLLLAVFLFIAYYSGKRDLLSPWFLLCLMLFATFAIVLFNYANWEVKINHLFVIYVCTAIVSFGLGGALVKSFSSTSTLSAIQSNSTVRLYVDDAKLNKRYPAYTLLAVSFGLAIIYIYKLLSDVSGAGSLGEKLRQIYNNIVYNNYSPGFIFNQMREVITAIAYVNTYRLMIKLFSRKDRTIVLFIVTALVTSDRNIFLRYAFYFICLYVLFFRQNCKGKDVNLKIIKKVLVLGIVALIIFFLLGKMKQYSSNLTRMISIYGGSGLYNYNLWLSENEEALRYGAATFNTFLNSFKTILGYVGINLDYQTLSRFDKFIEFQSGNGYIYSSNIYSALKPFTEDFGYFGVILFPFIIGAIYQWLYMFAQKSKYGFAWVLYSMLIYPVLFFPIAEQLFGRFSLGFVYELFWLAVIYYFAISKKRAVVIKRKIPNMNGVQNAKE